MKLNFPTFIKFRSISQSAQFFLLIFGLVIFYFSLLGLATGPWEGDSLAYHLPLAEQILKGNFGEYQSLLYYYPASVHVLLAGFMFFHIPLQLFNVVALVFLAASVYFLGRRLSLSESNSVIFAVTVSLLTPMARLVTTQTVDIYLAAIYATLLALLLKPQKSWQYFSQLGIIAGLLIGAKYTGPLFLVVLGLFFFNSVIKLANKRNLLLATTLTILVGGVWYLRNFILYGDPIYPANHPDFSWVKWHTWQTVFQSPGGWQYFLESLFSEYLFWPVIALGFIYLWLKRELEPLEKKLILLSLSNFVIHLLIPASINNVLSDFRYAVPTFICLLGAIFVFAQRKKQEAKAQLVSLISVLASFSLIMPHRPKIFVIYGMIIFCCWLGYRLQKLMTKKHFKF